MRITCNANVQRPSLSFSTTYPEYSKGILLFAIALVCALASSVFLSFHEINAQAQKSGAAPNQNQVFRVNVQVNNSANIDDVGTIHVFVDNTNISKVLNGAFFPSKSTVYQIVEFNATDIPVGKKFTVEIVYGDDKFKRSHGVNSPSKEPEMVKMTIP